MPRSTLEALAADKDRLRQVLTYHVVPGKVAALARDLSARAVAISVSRSSRGPESRRQLATLCDALPPGVRLIAGGEGAPADDARVETVGSFASLHEWARSIASS